MVNIDRGSRVEGTTQIVSARVRKTIQSIKEIVGNHSDADIYVALKETNMDPNETAQKLLNQDPFHPVKRKRDKKKESMAYNVSTDQRKHNENVVGQGMKSHSFSDRIARRGGYARRTLPGINREFWVVRDKRVNRNTSRDIKPASPKDQISANEQFVVNDFKMSTSGLKSSGGKNSSEASDGSNGPQPRHAQHANSNVSDGKLLMEKQAVVKIPVSRSSQVMKLSNSKQHSATLASTDPVHVPSQDSRAAAAVGAIKREIGVVGGRRQSNGSVKDVSAPSSSFTNSLSVRENSSETLQPFHAISKSGQLSQSSVGETVMPSIPMSRSFSNNQYGGRPHQQVVGHQKVPQANKEWRPKSSQKSAATSPGVIGTPTKSTPDKSKGFESKVAELQDSFSRAHVFENHNVIIAQHIRVPETDRCQVTFGSFGVDMDSSRNFESGFQTDGVTEESHRDSAVSLSASSQDASDDDASGNKQEELLDDQARNSVSDSPSLDGASETLLLDKNESSSPQNLDNYADIRLVRENSRAYTPDSRQQQDTPELPTFSAYDPQTGYDIPYFRPTLDDTIRGQGLPSPQEVLNSHMMNSIPASTIAMVQQQQQPPMAQMCPQVHVPHFTNLMPYRQFISPVFVPQMAVPGYSNNPGYPHPSNGSSYLLMPGGSTHLGANGLKYGLQQFKPVPGGSPTGFGNFSNPTGYAVNGPGGVGSATGLEDSSRIKYKESNLYVPNPQAETSELWVQNPRELPGLQSAPYYNVPGQTPHATYMPSHTGHASYNAAAAQFSHMQFPGLYHPSPQPAAMANPHHLGPAMGGNVGVGVAPGAQVGAYQQPQLGHLNWTSNF
ncbi:hypothetical protein HS088_TW02G00254 [Tripterygium wilfordii]|uniref:GBF-interacting protein 1 N-terminal domain-containing protein n=1 Tax=Tripterygium wilfordii TaxID=458696 RepID=A0A7J7DYI3_TRIWF|nr:uncharacterized protein LOC120014913 [Tripterygium wilfordii]KAF5751244.1 hypothetical protein HS088_TW02G00254 [Tripterygium wilfordii]